MNGQTTTNTTRRLERLFGALGDQTRLRIIKTLQEDPGICVSELAAELEVSQPAVSQHCRILEDAGVLQRQRQGQKTCYAVVSDTNDMKYLLKVIR